MQFGVNKHKWIFQRQGKVPFVVIQKFAGALYLYQITQEKLYYVDESDPRRNVHYLGSSANKAWKKKFRLVQDLNPWPLR